ncbi:ABC transporter permease [Parabacteroides chinchillae]
MFRHILKIMWNQRRSNGWIFAELLIVAGVLWTMVDMFYVDYRTYYSPLGYDITNVWRFKLSAQDVGTLPDSVPHMPESEKLSRLMDQIRQVPEVEDVCASFYSCPYSTGNSWRTIRPLDGDTANLGEESFQIRNVTPEYFRLFRVKTSDGKPVADEIAGVHNALVLSKEMAEMFYHGQPARGRKVNHSNYGQTFTVASVSSSIRDDEFKRPEPCFYQCLDGGIFNEVVDGFGAYNAELCVRMKKPYAQEEMNLLLQGMGDRLMVDNLFVYAVNNISVFRDRKLAPKENDMSNKISLMAFMLVNVFFGIIGTFWLRMQNRRGEIGLRMALGAHRISLKRYMYSEGLSLLLMTMPVLILFSVNLILLDYPDTYRQPLSLLRYLATFCITYGLMAVMILLGIWLPVRKALKMDPAEALHYE